MKNVAVEVTARPFTVTLGGVMLYDGETGVNDSAAYAINPASSPGSIQIESSTTLEDVFYGTVSVEASEADYYEFKFWRMLYPGASPYNNTSLGQTGDSFTPSQDTTLYAVFELEPNVYDASAGWGGLVDRINAYKAGDGSALGDSAGSPLNMLVINGESDISGISNDDVDGFVSLDMSDASNEFTAVGANAFSDDEVVIAAKLVSVTLPQSCESIGIGAFFNSTIREIHAPGVTSVSDYAFGGGNPQAKFLTTLDMPNLETASTYAFQGQPITSIPAGIKSIGDYAFGGGTFTSINLSEVTSLGASAFAGCTNLTSITFGTSSVAFTISDSAFNGCSKLASINLSGYSNLSIGAGAFGGCTILTTVEMPQGATIANKSSFPCGSSTGADLLDVYQNQQSGKPAGTYIRNTTGNAAGVWQSPWASAA
jgi:hypothetical protein